MSEYLENFPKSADYRKGMFSSEVRGLLFQVITSWQVIAMTVVLVMYMFLVNYVARTYHRPKRVSKSRPRKTKVKAAQRVKSGPSEVSDSANSNEALGLEEASR